MMDGIGRTRGLGRRMCPICRCIKVVVVYDTGLCVQEVYWYLGCITEKGIDGSVAVQVSNRQIQGV